MPSSFIRNPFRLTSKNHPHRMERGQGLVEFAIAFPLFLFVIMGVIEFGYLMFTYSSVFSATREAARYGASVGVNDAGVTHEKDCDGIRAAATRIGGIVGVTNATIDIRYDNGPTDTRSFANLPTCADAPDTVLGDRIVVRINFTFHSLIGVLPAMPIDNTDARSIIKSVDVTGDFPTAIPIIYTATSTRAPTTTATPTATFTPTATATATATATSTPTQATPTPNLTPTVTGCALLDWDGAGWDPYAYKFYFNIKNNSTSQTALVRSLTTNWTIPDGSTQYLNFIYSLSGSSLWSGLGTSPFQVGDSSSGAPNQWDPGATLLLQPNSTLPFTFTFSGNISMRLTSVKVQLGSDPNFICTLYPALP